MSNYFRLRITESEILKMCKSRAVMYTARCLLPLKKVMLLDISHDLMQRKMTFRVHGHTTNRIYDVVIDYSNSELSTSNSEDVDFKTRNDENFIPLITCTCANTDSTWCKHIVYVLLCTSDLQKTDILPDTETSTELCASVRGEDHNNTKLLETDTVGNLTDCSTPINKRSRLIEFISPTTTVGSPLH
jgi:hypothetical protein